MQGHISSIQGPLSHIQCVGTPRKVPGPPASPHQREERPGSPHRPRPPSSPAKYPSSPAIPRKETTEASPAHNPPLLQWHISPKPSPVYTHSASPLAAAAEHRDESRHPSPSRPHKGVGAKLLAMCVAPVGVSTGDEGSYNVRKETPREHSSTPMLPKMGTYAYVHVCILVVKLYTQCER
jgi:hypothetical protein